ncbi:unnamed protein product [Nesidiocoris tenuis]|uniref:Uncharacterized protein n=1 Tax=Nesidiocoris tenuis TaxID=355587 RepID=A0A6H5GSX0_9HEMI|nr:unnamed protein product [Nesidiocoris tenuis]
MELQDPSETPNFQLPDVETAKYIWRMCVHQVSVKCSMYPWKIVKIVHTPDYETAIQNKIRGHAIMYSSQPEIHQTNLPEVTEIAADKEPIYENVPFPWAQESEQRSRAASIQSAPEIRPPLELDRTGNFGSQQQVVNKKPQMQQQQFQNAPQVIMPQVLPPTPAPRESIAEKLQTAPQPWQPCNRIETHEPNDECLEFQPHPRPGENPRARHLCCVSCWRRNWERVSCFSSSKKIPKQRNNANFTVAMLPENTSRNRSMSCVSSPRRPVTAERRSSGCITRIRGRPEASGTCSTASGAIKGVPIPYRTS